MPESIASLIDHSLLHPTLTAEDVRVGCDVALRYQVAAVCVKPCDVPLAAALLAGSEVRVCTVIGFPHGSHATEAKAFEAVLACRQGASELDVVVNLGRVLAGDWDYVERDIRTVVNLAHDNAAITKVIFENDFLNGDVPKIRLCEISERCGAEFVKTSTGFGFVKQGDGTYRYRGATADDVRLMRRHCGPAVGIKAAGGVRDYAAAALMRELGCTRIGATATAEILAGEQAAGGPDG